MRYVYFNNSVEKLYGKPDLLMAFKNQLLVRILALLLGQFVVSVPLCAVVSVPTIHSVGLLRYQAKNWMGDLVDLSDPYTRQAINLLDSTCILGLLYVCGCFTVLTLEILILLSLMVKAVR